MFGAILPVILYFPFELHDLAIELLGHAINGGIDIVGVTFSMDSAAFEAQMDFRFLPPVLFCRPLHAQSHGNVDNLVKMPDDRFELVFRIRTNRGC